MEKVAHSLNGLPPSISLNTSDHFGGMPEISARNHGSFLYAANLQYLFIRAAQILKDSRFKFSHSYHSGIPSNVSNLYLPLFRQ